MKTTYDAMKNATWYMGEQTPEGNEKIADVIAHELAFILKYSATGMLTEDEAMRHSFVVFENDDCKSKPYAGALFVLHNGGVETVVNVPGYESDELHKRAIELINQV